MESATKLRLQFLRMALCDLLKVQETFAIRGKDTEMIGVVLWSDVREQKAVIWCEDHGNLAFFSKGSSGAMTGQRLDAGDVVQFDLEEERHLRVAHNPRLLAEDEYPTLANDLTRYGSGETDQTGRMTPASGRGQVINFPGLASEDAGARKLSA